MVVAVEEALAPLRVAGGAARRRFGREGPRVGLRNVVGAVAGDAGGLPLAFVSRGVRTAAQRGRLLAVAGGARRGGPRQLRLRVSVEDGCQLRMAGSARQRVVGRRFERGPAYVQPGVAAPDYLGRSVARETPGGGEIEMLGGRSTLRNRAARQLPGSLRLGRRQPFRGREGCSRDQREEEDQPMSPHLISPPGFLIGPGPTVLCHARPTKWRTHAMPMIASSPSHSTANSSRGTTTIVARTSPDVATAVLAAALVRAADRSRMKTLLLATARPPQISASARAFGFQMITTSAALANRIVAAERTQSSSRMVRTGTEILCCIVGLLPVVPLPKDVPAVACGSHRVRNRFSACRCPSRRSPG